MGTLCHRERVIMKDGLRCDSSGPIVPAEAAGCQGAPLSPSALGPYWACQVSAKNPRAENSVQTGLRGWGWPGAVRGRGVWEDVRLVLSICAHLDTPLWGLQEGALVQNEVGLIHFTQVGSPACPWLCIVWIRETTGAGCGVWLRSGPMALSHRLCENWN